MRAAYLLYGRTLVPMNEAPKAEAIAAYGVNVDAPHFVKVWTTRDGVFLWRMR